VLFALSADGLQHLHGNVPAVRPTTGVDIGVLESASGAAQHVKSPKWQGRAPLVR
jgi:hypothetical protein